MSAKKTCKHAQKSNDLPCPYCHGHYDPRIGHSCQEMSESSCNHGFDDYNDIIVRRGCIPCYFEQSEAALKKAIIQMTGMAAWLKSFDQPKVAESADRVIEQIQSVLNKRIDR